MPAFTYTDLDSTFDPNPITNDISRVTDEAAIIQAVKNLVRSEKYEIPFEPNLYCGLRGELFEPVTPITALAIKQKIKNAIQTYEPRVELIEVNVAPISTENGYDITIKILPRKNINPVTFSFFLERTL